ncbi:MAG: hypothetical protein PUF50_04085 [Erysipelotrichaceae bacterium]|nr:hypothetical protein [Erysipelotrichaceae bacterium]
MKEAFRKIGIFLLVALLIGILWRPLIWVMLIVMAVLIVIGLRIIFQTHRIKEEMDQQPQQYFENQEHRIHPEDVIDVEYTESEVKKHE